MKMKRVALLCYRAIKKGFVNVSDVISIWNFPKARSYYEFRRQIGDALKILEEAELEGYLIEVERNKWKITDKGKELIEKYRDEMKKREIKKLVKSGLIK